MGKKTKGQRIWPDNIYLFKVNNRNTEKRCKICSKLTKKGNRNDIVSIVDFELPGDASKTIIKTILKSIKNYSKILILNLISALSDIFRKKSI